MIVHSIHGTANFDRGVLKVRWRKIVESPAKKAGLLVRRIAIRSIRRDRSKSGDRPSKPGKPPRTRAPGDPLRRIYSVPQAMGTAVIVGPIGFGGRRPVTSLHEKGGYRTGSFLRRSGVTTRSAQGRFQRQKFVRRHATIRYAPRPYMRPALAKVIPKLPMMYRGSLSR